METTSTTQTPAKQTPAQPRPALQRRRMSPIAKIVLVAAFLAVGASACGPHSGGGGGTLLGGLVCVQQDC